MPKPDFADRRVLVVGGSSGVGRGIALAAAAQGARVAVVGRRAALLAEVAAETGGTAITADLAEPEDCARIADEAVAALGGDIHAVVHTAGVSPLMRIAHTPPEVWRRLMATNIIGPVLVTSAVLPALAPDALVAFTSSRSVGHPYHGVGAYSASKAALDQAILSLRLENPRVRFTRVEIGDTAGTDINRDFDMATRGELAPLWLSHGVLSEVLMDCGDLSGMITEALGQLLARPGISANNLVFHGAGGVLTSFDQKPSVGVPQPERLPIADNGNRR
ncbi:SDR family oxidoreductase [Yinghuangia aomiensis]|uniref:SDR family oxidoreductase n=1 Tax=Yinghuangia aomiensis TaxID=676205 RepID=A0ABP9I0E3_9ACTN